LGLSSCFDRQAGGDGPRDMQGNIVVPDDPEMSDPTFLASADAVSGDQGNFRVPAVGLECPLGSVNAVNGVLNPPGFSDAYVVRNMGVRLADASTGTVYVITHSVHGGGSSPGNYLIDVTNGTTSLKPGDEIYVGDKKYLFTESRIMPKEELGSHSDLFVDVPGRLILITCLQTPKQDKSYDNIVMIGQLAES
jgi:hypothetical protein